MEITEIKTTLKIETVLNHYGITPDKNGKTNCPFHNDKTPSMQIYPKSNTFCCFSSNCNAGTGDQIQFIELMEKQGKHQAILKAKELLVITKEVTPLNEVFEKLKQNINRSSRAKDYLKERHLENLIGTPTFGFGVGFNAGSYKDLKHCIVFPLKNKLNQTVSLYGRSIMNSKSGSDHYYTANRKGLYPKYPPAGTRKLILTESIIDAATLLQQTKITAEYEILALYGTNGLTKLHLEAIKELKHLTEIVIWLDGDEAGRKATANYEKQLTTLLNSK